MAKAGNKLPPRRTRTHLERILFVVGKGNAGKSRLLRSMFVDPRFGTDGQVPDSSQNRRGISTVQLSRERCLSIRYSSPHENYRSLPEFLADLDKRMANSWKSYWRFNFACAMQPFATKKTPSVVDICAALEPLYPERVRLVQVHPRQDDEDGDLLASTDADRLRAMNVEVVTIDGRWGSPRKPHPNGQFLADFFDFL